MTTPDDLTAKRITVMGLGRFGGGVGVTRFLASRGAIVTVTDRADAELLADSIAKIQPWIDTGAVTLRLGEHVLDDFTKTELVVASPAVPKPWDNEFLNAAMNAGVRITTEIGLLVERLGDPARVVGITGSAGKSTTTAMTAHAINVFLQARNDQRACHLGGNIGGSLLDHVDDIAPGDIIVLELSSAMLHWLSQDKWSPGVAVVTNIGENHLDWHGEQQHYESCKRAIIDHQREGDTAIVPRSLEHFAIGARSTPVVVDTAQQTEAMDGLRLRLPGAHNRDNAHLASIAASTALNRAGVDTTTNECARTLAAFKSLPHRLELVADVDGLRAYNDSKSTTPESAARAIEAIMSDMEDAGDGGAPAIHLIAGGSDKGADFAPLAEAAVRCAVVYTIGLTGPAIAAAVKAAGGQVHECGDLPTAVAKSIERAGDRGVILLSPACASYDQFRSYDERGEIFTRLVRDGIACRTKPEKISK